MKAIVVASAVAEILQDYDTGTDAPAGITWTTNELIRWVNDAQRAVALVRPDSTSVVNNIELVDGTKQSLPTGGLRLLSIVRNTGSDGTTIGRAVMGPVAREVKDSFDPDWHTADAKTTTKEYLFDDREPTVFWVSPPAVAGQQLEAIWSQVPAEVTVLENDDLSVTDVYVPALQEWMLYRCFSRDAETTPNYARAGNHMRNFFNILGVKMQSDRTSSPKMRTEQVETERPNV